MPYCLYVRKSRADAEAEARGEGETLSRHINALSELARRRQLAVTQVYREVASGESLAARPVMQRLLSEVEAGLWEGVLVMEVERLARGDSIDQGIVAQAFKLSGTKIITPIKDYDPNDEFDEEYFEFGLFMSRREYKTINRRLQRGRMASVKEGRYVGSTPPYGYARVKIQGDKGYTLEPVPAEADVVRMIFEWYTVGERLDDGSRRRLGTSLIVRRLNSLHIPPRRSASWAVATVRDILINPVYIGKICWNRRPASKKVVDGRVTVTRPRASEEARTMADGLHPPIVDEEVFYQAQELMAQNPPKPIGENSTVKNPLAGLVVCGKCGHKMVRRPYKGDYPDTLLCQNPACDNVSCFLSSIEERILGSLEGWLSEYKLKWKDTLPQNSGEGAASLTERSLRLLEKECETLSAQLDKTFDLLEQGVYTAEQFSSRSKLLEERLGKARADRDALSKTLEEARLLEENRRTVIPRLEHLLKIYNTLPSARAKNDMLKEVIERVTYVKTKKGRWHNSPDDFEITLYPKIPRAN